MTTTQQQHPWKATTRTVLAVVIGAASLTPYIVTILDEQLQGWEMLGLGGQAVAVAAIVTRIIALPRVDRLLEHVGLGSAPKVPGHGDHAA